MSQLAPPAGGTPGRIISQLSAPSARAAPKRPVGSLSNALRKTKLAPTEENLHDLDLIAQAREADDHAFQRIPDDLTDDQFMARVKDIIKWQTTG